MKKVLCLACATFSLMVVPAMAEMIAGEIIAVEGNLVTVKTKEGEQMSFQTNDGTTYRKKALNRHHKKKRGMRGPTDWTYEPIAEEDDWVEIVYNPKTGNGDIYEVDTMTVYDD